MFIKKLKKKSKKTPESIVSLATFKPNTKFWNEARKFVKRPVFTPKFTKPTEKQFQFLEKLGYVHRLPFPLSRSEASRIITERLKK